ncbi:MAG TPA: hypothetical protein VIV06_00110 [Candidatus Limnocylindrales bacterium]
MTFTIARIERDSEAAAGRFLRDRNVLALEEAMERLEAEEANARTGLSASWRAKPSPGSTISPPSGHLRTTRVGVS